MKSSIHTITSDQGNNMMDKNSPKIRRCVHHGNIRTLNLGPVCVNLMENTTNLPMRNNGTASILQKFEHLFDRNLGDKFKF
jgi:hypothetical protein